jgi:hypothetical protein
LFIGVNKRKYISFWELSVVNPTYSTRYTELGIPAARATILENPPEVHLATRVVPLSDTVPHEVATLMLALELPFVSQHSLRSVLPATE